MTTFRFDTIRLKGLYDIDLPVKGLNPSASYILKAADGLGPPDVDVTIMNAMYLGRDPVDREITLRVGLQPNYAVGERASDLRERLYGLLTPGVSDEVLIELRLNNVVKAQIQAQVRQMPINPFSDDPEMQIVLPCYGSFLYAQDQYEHPMPTNQFLPVFNNIGTAPTGFKFDVQINVNRTSWFIKRGVAETPSFQQMWFFHDFVAGDTLRVNTIPGQIHVRRIRGGVVTNIIDSVSTDSTWLMLHGGANSFQCSGSSHEFTFFAYTPKFWGI